MASPSHRPNKHPSVTAIRFFKIILTKTLLDGKIKIPKKFTRKCGGGLSNPMFLKPPDGSEWKVYWSKLDGEIWLQDGWREFARNYSLDHGHLVLFEYKETSLFDVHIFDMSSLEIEYPIIDQTSDDSVDILDELPPCQSQKNRLKSPVSSPQPHKKLRSGTTGDVEIKKFQSTNLAQHVQTIDVKETQRALEEAKKFTSEKPFFKVNIRQCYLESNRPCLSRGIFRNFFKNKRNVMIQFGQKLWPVELLYDPYRASAKLSTGWTLFARESKLQAGDVCIFELINIEDAVLDVHIFRGHTKGFHSKKLKTCTTGYVEESSKLQNMTWHVQTKEDTDAGIFTTQCPKVEELASNETTVALDRAPTFRSENPYFVHVMKPSNVNGYALNIPSEFVAKYFKKTQDQGDVLLHVLDGRTWSVNYNGKRFRGGWNKFASDNNLNVGDVCVFELTESQGLSFKVLIFQGEKPSCPLSQGTKATQGASLLITPRPKINEAMKEAEKFTSENPFFRVNIKPSHLGKNRPNVSKHFFRNHFQNKGQNLMIQYERKSWPVKLLYVPCIGSAQFSDGWPLFVKESKLEAGDVCIFELINTEDTVLDVHIFRGHK